MSEETPQSGRMEGIPAQPRATGGWWAWLENFGRDIRFSLRSLRRAPGFSLAVIVTLTLCIGANTTIFSVLYGLVLKSLPYHEPGQLVEIYNSFSKTGQPKRQVSVAQYLDYKENADQFEGFALSQEGSFTVGEETDPARVTGTRMTADYFSLLGVQPLLGRFYTMEDCVPGRDNVVVLTQSFWESNFRADPAIVGQVIRLTGLSYTVIGVAPRKLEEFNRIPVLFVPLSWNANLAAPQARVALNSIMYARVKAGVAPTAALAQLAALEKRFHDQVAPPVLRDMLDRDGYKIELGLVRAEQTKPVKTGILLLQGGALFVLLLGCLNVASLMLARANARQTELAVRQALGAGRWTLARQLFTESLLLGGLGAATGVALAWASLRVINRYTALIIRQAPPISVDGTVLGVTLLASLAVALLIGLLPAMRLWRANLLGSIQGGSRSASAGGGMRAISGLLVTAQVALALILLVGASLLIRSFSRVMAIDPGFDAARIVHARVAFNATYQDVNKAHRTGELIVAKMREIPGVEAAGMTSHITINGGFNRVNLPIRGSVAGQPDTFPAAQYFGVSPEFFSAMGIRLVEGRVFTDADNLPQARPVFIVDRDFAEKNFPGRSAVGQALGANSPNQPPETWPVIVGVVEPARFNGPEDRSGVPFVFGPVLHFQFNGFSMVLRTNRPLADMAPLMRAKLSSIDPSLPLYGVGTLQTLLDNLVTNRRGVMLMLGAFALIALLLSAVGIYGMLAYDVTQRTREIGIRGAIGASRGQIVGLILRQGLWKAGLGLAIGLAGAFYLSRFMASMLFDVRPSDPVAYLGVSLVLLLVALVASYLPARRASKVDPIIALRCE
jgi:predicted permease